MDPEHLASRLRGFGTTIFAEMSALAVATGSVNLGQGFPDTDGPAEIAEAAIAAIRAGHNQYPPGPGIAPLREAIAAHQQRFYGLAVDPDQEILVTAGATEALAATSSRLNTLPVGLCGELSSTKRVRSVMAARSSSTSNA
jgi:N-succinyldiaminopimelate aminotransferase